MMLFERARCPPNERPEVADAPCCGVLSVVTPGRDDGEADEVAAVDGQVVDLLLADHGRDRGLDGVDDRSCRADRDRLGSSRAQSVKFSSASWPMTQADVVALSAGRIRRGPHVIVYIPG